MKEKPKALLSPMVVSVSPYMRSGEKGPEDVKGYHAQRLKDLNPKESSKNYPNPEIQQENLDFNKEYDIVTKSIFDSDGALRDDVPTRDVEQHVKRLFTLSPENGVDTVVHDHPDFLSSLYDQQNQKASAIDLATAHHRDALSLLLDPENIQTIIKSTDALQSRFKSHFGINSERVDPFTFRFSHEADTGLISSESKKSAAKLIQSKIKKLNIEYPMVLRSDAEDIVSQGQCLSDLQNAQNKRENLFSKNGAESAILSNIRNLNGSMLSAETWAGVESFLNKNGINILKMHYGKPDDIFHLMTRELSKAPHFKGKKELISTFKKLSSSSIVPAFNLMIRTGMNPDIIASNPNFMKSIISLADGVRQHFSSNGKTKADVYVSRNPLNILTMAPEKSCASCQSITKNGKISVDHLKINIPASYNAQSTNDFIMYTIDKNGQKNARMSFSYHKKTDTYINQEKNAVYGSSKEGRSVLNDFVKKGAKFVTSSEMGNIGKRNEYEKVNIGYLAYEDVKSKISVWYHINKVKASASKAEKIFHSKFVSSGVEGANEVYKVFSAGYKRQENQKNDLADYFMNGINDLYYERIESTKSLLYGSPSHSLVSGSKYLTEKFLKDLKKTSSFLDSVHRKMREVME